MYTVAIKIVWSSLLSRAPVNLPCFMVDLAHVPLECEIFSIRFLNESLALGFDPVIYVVFRVNPFFYSLDKAYGT